MDTSPSPIINSEQKKLELEEMKKREIQLTLELKNLQIKKELFEQEVFLNELIESGCAKIINLDTKNIPQNIDEVNFSKNNPEGVKEMFESPDFKKEALNDTEKIIEIDLDKFRKFDDVEIFYAQGFEELNKKILTKLNKIIKKCPHNMINLIFNNKEISGSPSIMMMEGIKATRANWTNNKTTLLFTIDKNKKISTIEEFSFMLNPEETFIFSLINPSENKIEESL